MQLGQAGPYFQAIVTARGAAYKVFLIIDRVKRYIYIYIYIYVVYIYIYIYIYILFKGSLGVLFHPCLVFEIFWSYSCSPATLPNRASAGSLFTLISLSGQLALACYEELTGGNILNNELY